MMKQANDCSTQSNKSNRLNEPARQICTHPFPDTMRRLDDPNRLSFDLVGCFPLSVGLHLGTGGHHIAIGIPHLVCKAALEHIHNKQDDDQPTNQAHNIT